MKKMKAVVFERPGEYSIKEVDVPVITSEDEVIVEVEASSICGTDVHITANPPGYEAKPNVILGHEFCGYISEIGKNVTHLKVGDRVVVNPNNYCGTCVYCRKNLPNQCENIEPIGIDYDGSFTKFIKVSSKIAYKISKKVPFEVAACVEPLACALNGLNKINAKPGDSAVVIGAGPIGLILAMLLQKSGVEKIFILETTSYRLEFTKKLNLGIVINPIEEDAKEIVLGQTTIGADIVFDVTGSQILPAIDLVRKDGSVVLFGVNKKAVAQLPQSLITTKEISVLGTWLANATFPEAVKVLEQECIDVKSLVTDVIALDDIKMGIDKLAKGEAVKIIVKSME